MPTEGGFYLNAAPLTRGNMFLGGGSKINIAAPLLSYDFAADSCVRAHPMVFLLATVSISFSAQYLRTMRHLLIRANTSFLSKASAIFMEFPGSSITGERLSGYFDDALFVLLRLRELYVGSGVPKNSNLEDISTNRCVSKVSIYIYSQLRKQARSLRASR